MLKLFLAAMLLLVSLLFFVLGYGIVDAQHYDNIVIPSTASILFIKFFRVPFFLSSFFCASVAFFYSFNHFLCTLQVILHTIGSSSSSCTLQLLQSYGSRS